VARERWWPPSSSPRRFFQAGYHVQSFPLFGVERRGAPVEAYLRLDRTKILVRTHVYTPDHVVVLDHTLLATADVTRGLKRSGWILLNAPEPPEGLASFAGFHFAFVDGTRIALQHRLGTRTHPIVNTALTGALARVLGVPPLTAIAEAIREEVRGWPRKTLEQRRPRIRKSHSWGSSTMMARRRQAERDHPGRRTVMWILPSLSMTDSSRYN